MRPSADLEMPWLRDELIERLGQLADADWLAVATAGPRGTQGPSMELDETLDFFDDTGIFEDPGARIGVLLLDQIEAEAISAVGEALERVLERRGTADWGLLGEASKKSLKVLRRHD